MPMQDPAHPGPIILHECIEPLGLTIAAAADALGVPASSLSPLVTGSIPLSPEMAIRVGKVFGGSARSWYAMQAAYDLAQAEKCADDIQVARRLWPASPISDEPSDQQPTYEYNPDSATVSIPLSEIIHLHRGTLGAVRTMAQQLTVIEESIGVSALEQDHYATRIASLRNRLNANVRLLSDMTLPSHWPHENESDNVNLSVTVDHFLTMQASVQGIARMVNLVFDDLAELQSQESSVEFSFTDLDDLARAEYVVEAWHEFVLTQPDLQDSTVQPATTDSPGNFGELFQEIEAFLHDNPVPKLIAALST